MRTRGLLTLAEDFLVERAGRALKAGEVQQFGPVWEGVDYAHVRSLGRPAVVVAGIDVTDPAASVPGRELIFDFIGIHLGLDGNGVTFHYTADIPGDQIVDIWHPGDPGYDRYSHFPRG
ncbi:hypothetical protein OG871_12245 [Kitasatospora sp. NBC_00374]|uniref:hypothetical protein n=1 Tax=Kitasatospora sp. NBC_00374 TaxID=2975964 RepID=UPI0030E17717